MTIKYDKVCKLLDAQLELNVAFVSPVSGILWLLLRLGGCGEWGGKGDTLILGQRLKLQTGKCLDAGNCFPERQNSGGVGQSELRVQGPLLNYNSRDAQQKGAPRPALPRPARLGGRRPPSGTQQGTLATSAAAGE